MYLQGGPKNTALYTYSKFVTPVYVDISNCSVLITVCTVVQNCCNGRSKKYRKWHFWGCSLSETLQRIDIKFGRDDYVGDGSQYAKWHINRFRGVISAKGWNVNGLCFFIFKYFVCSLAPLGSNRWTDFDEWYVKMRVRVFGWVAFLFGLEQWRHNFRGQKFKNRLKLAWIGVFQPKCQS